MRVLGCLYSVSLIVPGFALGEKRCQIVSRQWEKVKKKRWLMSGEQDTQRGQNWVDRLMRAMQNLSGAKKGSLARKKPAPEDYAWKETEEEYQKAQAEWLERVHRDRKKSRDES